jgi:hypothetical protein
LGLTPDLLRVDGLGLTPHLLRVHGLGLTPCSLHLLRIHGLGLTPCSLHLPLSLPLPLLLSLFLSFVSQAGITADGIEECLQVSITSLPPVSSRRHNEILECAISVVWQTICSCPLPPYTVYHPSSPECHLLPPPPSHYRSTSLLP